MLERVAEQPARGEQVRREPRSFRDGPGARRRRRRRELRGDPRRLPSQRDHPAHVQQRKQLIYRPRVQVRDQRGHRRGARRVAAVARGGHLAHRAILGAELGELLENPVKLRRFKRERRFHRKKLERGSGVGRRSRRRRG